MVFPKVSVVVPVYNGQKTVKKCIQSLLDLDYPIKKLELIFVDDGSTDDTEKIIKSIKKNDIKINYFKQKRRGPAAARNFGVKNSKGEILAFTDVDCFVTKKWLKNLIKPFKDKRVGGVGGAIFNYNPQNELEKYLAKRAPNLQGHLDDSKPYLVTANAAYAREALDVVGLFDENIFMGEDADLSWRVSGAGFDIVYEPTAIVYHKNRSTVFGLATQWFGYGISLAQLKIKYNFPEKAGERILIKSKLLSALFFRFLSKLLLFVFGKAKSENALEPLYAFIMEFNYLAGYIYAHVFGQKRIKLFH